MMILIASCGTGPSRVVLTNVCPHVIEYSQDEQAQVADELATLAVGARLREWMKDYKVMRDESRACAR